jgi:transposase
VRTLLIHGARAVISHVEKKTDPRSQWIKSLKGRCGFNRAAVALANKNARIIWALLAKETKFSSKHYDGFGITNAPARDELLISAVGAC